MNQENNNKEGSGVQNGEREHETQTRIKESPEL